MRRPLVLLVFLLLGIFLFNAGFAVYLRPVLYTLTPLQRYYLDAYLASSLKARNPAAQTDIEWIWKFKAKVPKDKTGSRTRDKKSDKEKIPMEFAREEDRSGSSPGFRAALGRRSFAVHDEPAGHSRRMAGDQQRSALPRERCPGEARS